MAAQAAAAYFLPILPEGLNPHDEGIRLVGGELVLAGALPYRDFYTNYGPAQSYWAAALFLAFGTQVLSLRIGILLVNAFAAAALWALCRYAGAGCKAAAAALLLFLLCRQSVAQSLYACDPALALILAAAAALAVESGGPRRSLAIGLLLGLAALFRFDFGAYATAAATAAVAVRRDRPARSVLALWSGVAATAGPAYAFLAMLATRTTWLNIFVYLPAIMP